MRGESWHQVQEIFESALELEPGRRPAFLNDACRSRRELKAEVESLLAAHDAPDERLARLELLAPDAWDGRRIGSYLLHHELGRGGMSIVYLGERVDAEFEQKVAVKLVKPGVHALELGRRLQAERQILARLSHPNIAKLYDGGTTPEGLPYFVMEHVEGQRIDQYCDQRCLTIEARLALFVQVCGAVSYAHRHLVVHRDIKPSNLIVRDDGIAVLLDFGIARILDRELEADEDARGHSRPMTPSYASPEQLRGDPASTVSDVYSLGILLYELLAGKAPRERQPTPPPSANVGQGNRTDLAQARRIRPDRLRRRLEGDLDAITLRAIRHEPGERYPSVELLAADVHRHFEQRPVTARRGGWRYRGGKFVRRNRLAVSLAAFLALVSVGLMVVTSVLAAQMALQRNRAEAQRERAQQTARFLIELFNVAEGAGGDLSASELLHQGAEKMARHLGVDSDLGAPLHQALGSAYRRLGLYEQAGPLLEKALRLRRQHLGSTDPEIAESLLELSLLRRDTGDYDRSEDLARQALKMQKEALGDDEVDLAEALDHLGWLQRLQGRFDEAGELYRQAYELRLEHYGEEHRSIFRSLEKLAALASSLERPAEALELYRRALSLGEKALGEDHPDLTITIKDLALALQNKGQLEEAEDLLRRALALERKAFGETHPRFSGTLIKLGALLRRRGDATVAEELFRQALGSRRQVFGDEHPRVAEVLHNLGKLLAERGSLDEAEDALQQSVRIMRGTFPDGSPESAFSLDVLGMLLLARGEPRRAEPYLREALSLRQRFLRPDSALLAESREHLEQCVAALDPDSL